jgi:transcriptional regulator with XRE-family HTH domain
MTTWQRKNGTMEKRKRQRLEAQGWKVGSAEQFLDLPV